MLSTVVSQSVNVHLLGLREVNLNSRAAQLFDVLLDGHTVGGGV